MFGKDHPGRALLERMRRMEEALKPFAEAGKRIHPNSLDEWLWGPQWGNDVTLGIFRRAAAALSKEESK